MEIKEYINAGVSPFHAVLTVKQRLAGAGFKELALGEDGALERGNGYYISPYPSVIFAFRVNEAKSGAHIALAHTDSPSFMIKPNPELPEQPYLRLNVEPYGGMLKRTWFDRPLGVAGRVELRNREDIYAPIERLFDSREAWFIIPSLAPHLDHEIETAKIDAQKVLVPIYGLRKEKEYTFLQKLAEALGIEKEDVLSYTLYLYNLDEASEIGVEKELLSAPRIDNLASVAALTEGLIASESSMACLSMIACFDNEEIGSRSKQGADSELLKLVLADIYRRLGRSEQLAGDHMRSFLLSVDGAHGVHPNYKEKSDVTAQVVLGGGVCLKSSASQRYVTDAKAAAIIKGICEQNGIALQEQANRSGAPGGQTLGPIASSYLPMIAADIGIPMLAMHSARELAATKDYEELCKLIKAFL